MNQIKPIVKFEHFNFTYEGSNFPGLSDLNLSIYPGEFVLLTGKSGCGKTTFTRCINGLIPDFYEGRLSGSCEVCGMEISEHEAGDYSSFVGSVFQDPRSQFFTLHVNTEIAFQSENLQHDRGTIQEKYMEAVDVLELQSLLNKSIFHLSSGEKQKIAVASAYTAGVHIFVLDEPSANLDESGTKQLAGVLKKLKKEGNTIIISEHKLYYLKDLIDRVIYMENGKVKADVKQAEFLSYSPEWMKKHSLRQMDLRKIKPSIPVIYTKEKIKQLQEGDNGTELQVNSLSFYYDKKTPLWSNVSFTAKSGDIVGVVGKNGAGKSTLLRVLMGLEKQRRGNILFNGERASPKQRRKLSFYVMQDVDYQLFAATVLEEMLLDTPSEEPDMERAMCVLEQFGLSDYAKVHPSQLSGGQKQRLSIALAYMSEAEFLFLDEPSSGLDEENMQLVSQAITELAEKGRCLFVITHDYELAARTFRSLLIFKETKQTIRISPESYDEKVLYDTFNLLTKETKK